MNLYTYDDIIKLLDKRIKLHQKELTRETNVNERMRIEGQIRECNNLKFIIVK